jgi:HAD superfamily hydrolase (TIGR01549 family)
MSRVRAVVFDLGETLIDETHMWGSWADRLGIPRLTFFGALGGVIERGQHHLSVFEVLGLTPERLAEAAAARPERPAAHFRPEDLYPDAVPCLEALRARGYRTGIAGNQPVEWAERLRQWDLPVDFIGCSGEWGVEKPSPDFFARIVEAAGVEASEVAYVGDRVDNDVAPAAGADMVAVFIRRGPWGVLHATRPEATRASLRIESLDALPEALASV